MGNGFKTFLEEEGIVAQAFMDMSKLHSENCSLDRKTNELAYLAVLSAVRLTDGITFHVKLAKKLGATRNEVKSAILVGLPAVGIIATESLDIALQSYDE